MTNIKLQIKMKIKFINIFFLTVLLLTIASCTKTDDNNSVSSAQPPDLSKHPVYSKYQFNNTDNVINLGTQPLYMPTGLITETMKRDIILKKALNKLGIEIRFYSFLKGHDVNFFLKKGDIDAGIGGDMPAITIASTSEVIIPSLMQNGFVSIVAEHHMLIEQMRGKRFGYAIGSNAHYSLLHMFQLRGIAATDVRLIPINVVEMPEALAAGNIDAFSAWEPTPFLTRKLFPDKVVIHRSLSTGYLYFSRALYEKHPDAVLHMLAAQLRAFYWIKHKKENLLNASRWNIDENNKLSDTMSELSDVDISKLAVDDIIGHHSSPVIPLQSLSRTGNLYKEFKFLKELGMVPLSIAWEKVRDSFAPQILDGIYNNPSVYRFNEFDYDIDGDGSEQ